jgi:hypothetical protein
MRGARLQTAEELLAEIQKMMGEISPEPLLDVFHDWIARYESVITSDGNCFESTVKWSYLFYIIPLSGKDTTLGAGHPEACALLEGVKFKKAIP